MAALRKFVLTLTLIAAVAAAAIFVWQRQHQAKRPDVSHPGDTVLVYEIDEDRLQGEHKVDPDNLAEAVRRRLDAASLSGVAVRPVGANRVEITIPRGSDEHKVKVAAVKDLIPQVGTLELRILANADDDHEVFDAVQHNPEELKRLKAAALGDRAPPAPYPANGPAFATDLGNFTYSWVELSPALALVYGVGESDSGTPFGKEAEAARKSYTPILHAARGEYRTTLLYGRDVRHPGRLPFPEHDKKYEWFILCRDPARDEQGRSKAVTGEYLSKAHGSIDSKTDKPAIGFQFNDEGTALLAELTKNNLGRQMAIVLNDRILLAPNVQSPITEGTGLITGDYTLQEVGLIAAILRSGALPAPLKFVSVGETTAEPSK